MAGWPARPFFSLAPPAGAGGALGGGALPSTPGQARSRQREGGEGEGEAGSEARGQGSSPDDRRCPRGSGQQMDGPLPWDRAFPLAGPGGFGAEKQRGPGRSPLLALAAEEPFSPCHGWQKRPRAREPFSWMSFVAGI